MMEFKGYTGQITAVDEEQGVITGRVADLIDVITFEGRNFQELVQAFHDSVDDYLEMCEERKESPEKPFSGRFLLRITPDLHMRAALAAKRSRKSLNAWVASAIEAQLDREQTAPKHRTNGASHEDLNALIGLLELRLLRELRERGEDVPSESPKGGKG